MTSVGSMTRMVSLDNEFYIPVASLIGKVYALSATTNTLSTALWANSGPYTSSINAAGAGLLKDVGRTFLSAGRTFRKVQLVVPTGTNSTFGVGGNSGTAPMTDYLTGFIEVGFDAQAAGSAPAPVAKWGR